MNIVGLILLVRPDSIKMCDDGWCSILVIKAICNIRILSINAYALKFYFRILFYMERFIHFGCWNNMKNGTVVRDVMTSLKRRIADSSAPSIDFITVAGDNYYPDKREDGNGKKKKTIDAYDLEDGFGELPDEPDIYMILGNHDLDTNNASKPKSKLFINDAEEEGCNILTLQQNSVANISNIQFELYKEIMMSDDTLVLMIDTSMYEDNATKYIECYRIFLEDPSLDIDKLRKRQLEDIRASLKKYSQGIKNLILIGHHPIIGVKYKDGGIKVEAEIPFFKDALREIYSLTKDVNHSYLCADIHLYQKGDISIDMGGGDTMNIEQHIVGTGGTKLDPDVPREYVGETVEKKGATYTMAETVRANGYLECDIASGTPEFTFTVASKKRRNYGTPVAGPARRKMNRRRSPSARSKSRSARSKSRSARSKSRSARSKSRSARSKTRSASKKGGARRKRTTRKRRTI